jgi:hypothetical protein
MNNFKNINTKLLVGLGACALTLAAIALCLPKLSQNDLAISTAPGSFNLKLGSEESAFSDSVRMIDGNSMGYAPSVASYASDSYIPSPMPPYGSEGGTTAAEAEPRIIKTADLALGVDGVAAKVQEISTLATGRGGFVQSSTILEDEDAYKTGYITIRVPTEVFDDTIATIKKLAVRIDRESINGQDVTEQYTDTEARLRSAKAQEEQYLLILDKAETVQDILSVQSYLQSIRYEIESLEGRLQSLGNQTEYATISVTLQEEVKIQIPTEKFDLGRNIKLAAQYVVLLAQTALTYVVWLVIVGGAIFVPLSLFVGLVLFVTRKIMLRL